MYISGEGVQLAAPCMYCAYSGQLHSTRQCVRRVYLLACRSLSFDTQSALDGIRYVCGSEYNHQQEPYRHMKWALVNIYAFFCYAQSTRPLPIRPCWTGYSPSIPRSDARMYRGILVELFSTTISVSSPRILAELFSAPPPPESWRNSSQRQSEPPPRAAVSRMPCRTCFTS